MTFNQPLFLLGLLAVPTLLGLSLLAQKRRRRYVMRFTDVSLLASVVGRSPGWRRHLPPVLFLLAAAALVVGIAGPVLNLAVPRNDASVMLVIDVSGSMAATDVAPTRMEAARAAAAALVKKLPAGDRVGLIAFNTQASVLAPLSDQRDTVQQALDSLRANGGTAIGDALQLGVDQFASATAKVAAGTRPANRIVLLTDGVSNHGIQPLAAAEGARAAGIPVYTIGIGSRNADVVVKGQPVGGVDEQGLSAVAAATGGKYFFAQEATQLNQIYADLGTQFGWRVVKYDITIPVLVIGTVIILAAAGLSLVWFRVLP
jgi:Ca-activated chloride channel family protein